jgi:uncharacterized membrane-anchored protein
MRLFLTLIILGLGLTLLGFVILFGSIGGGLPIEVAFAGLALGVILGPITFISGFVVYAFRRPTPNELASQKADDYRTWHFQPAGLLILVIGLAAFVVLGNWAEQYVPHINSGRRPLSGYIFGLVCLALLSFRKVRNLIFYTGEIPKAEPAEDKSEVQAEPGAAADRGRDTGF